MQLLSLEIVGIILSWEEHLVNSIINKKKQPGSSQTNLSKKIKKESGIFSKLNKESEDLICFELNLKKFVYVGCQFKEKIG